jgi:hypothetical protein
VIEYYNMVVTYAEKANTTKSDKALSYAQKFLEIANETLSRAKSIISEIEKIEAQNNTDG